MRSLSLIALVTAAALLSACGDTGEPAAPPGSPDNPLVAEPAQKSTTGRSNESHAGSTQALGYRKLVEHQSSKPRTRFTPCNLVSRGQARAILGVAVQAPFEAPQGPTCVYRSKSGSRFVTIAVQPLDFDRLKKQMRRPQAVDVSNRSAYCGIYGQPMLYVELSRDRVLSVAAPCPVAKQFATRAVARLEG
jgi:hypothetical protein